MMVALLGKSRTHAARLGVKRFGVGVELTSPSRASVPVHHLPSPLAPAIASGSALQRMSGERQVSSLSPGKVLKLSHANFTISPRFWYSRVTSHATECRVICDVTHGTKHLGGK